MDSTHDAFQAFMLAGKGGKHSPGLPQTPNTSTPKSDRKDRGVKTIGPAWKAFQGRVHEWRENDDQLRAVVDSISNLRDRIWWETKELESIRNMEQLKPWETGLRAAQRSVLTYEDVELAQTHDLLQHEKMLSTLRSLIANLAKIQDAMSRRLDELMLMQLEHGLHQLDSTRAQDIYQVLASELLRKQNLVQSILASSNDGLLAENPDGGDNPRVTVRRSLVQWDLKDSSVQSQIQSFLEERK